MAGNLNFKNYLFHIYILLYYSLNLIILFFIYLKIIINSYRLFMDFKTKEDQQVHN